MDTIVTQGKWRSALKFLMGLGTNPELQAREQRQLKALLIDDAPLTAEQARTALRQLGWHTSHENDLLTAHGTRQPWEEAIFSHATHFNVFRLGRRRQAGTFPTRHSVAYYTFPEAIADAGPDVHALVYAVTADGSNFCIPREEWSRYGELWEAR